MNKYKKWYNNNKENDEYQYDDSIQKPKIPVVYYS